MKKVVVESLSSQVSRNPFEGQLRFLRRAAYPLRKIPPRGCPSKGFHFFTAPAQHRDATSHRKTALVWANNVARAKRGDEQSAAGWCEDVLDYVLRAAEAASDHTMEVKSARRRVVHRPSSYGTHGDPLTKRYGVGLGGLTPAEQHEPVPRMFNPEVKNQIKPSG
jgi:hypothetical protein